MGKNKAIYLEPEKFAELVVSSHQIHSEDYEEIAKKKLTLYLTALTLAERFNTLESAVLAKAETQAEFKNALDRLLTLGAFGMTKE